MDVKRKRKKKERKSTNEEKWTESHEKTKIPLNISLTEKTVIV